MERLWRATINSWNGLVAVTRSEAAFRQELALLAVGVPLAFLVTADVGQRFALIGVLFVLANLFYWGIRATLRQLNIPLVVLDIPYAWVYVIVPLTALLMTVRTLAVMSQDVSRYRHGDALEPEIRGVV